jgi:uncharacterized membrane protein
LTKNLGVVEFPPRTVMNALPLGAAVRAMKATSLAAVFLLLASAAPAFASKYYVVQNSKTLKCSVVPKKPKGKTVVLVGSGTAYKTRNDARVALRSTANCKSGSLLRPDGK